MKEAMILVMFAVALGQGPDADPPNSFEQPFADAGIVYLKLASGDYTIRAGAGDRVVIRWQADDPANTNEMKKIKIRANVAGKAVAIRTDGPAKKARIFIEVPPHSDLQLRMRAGDIRISGIEGNKDISMTAGDLVIDDSPSAYSHIHASVTVGDLRARPLGFNGDGFRNSFDWNGSGKYTLRATLFAGDLTFHKQ